MSRKEKFHLKTFYAAQVPGVPLLNLAALIESAVEQVSEAGGSNADIRFAVETDPGYDGEEWVDVTLNVHYDRPETEQETLERKANERRAASSAAGFEERKRKREIQKMRDAAERFGFDVIARNV